VSVYYNTYSICKWIIVIIDLYLVSDACVFFFVSCLFNDTYQLYRLYGVGTVHDCEWWIGNNMEWKDRGLFKTCRVLLSSGQYSASYPEVSGSNLNPEPDSPDWEFSRFPQYLQANFGIVPWIRPRPLPSTSFPTRHSTLEVYIQNYWMYREIKQEYILYFKIPSQFFSQWFQEMEEIPVSG
jgi:hypothetical protein